MREQLRTYQAALGYTDDDMAEFLKVKEFTYRSYKGAREASPQFKTVVDFATKMMVSLDWLGGRDEPMWYAPAFAPYAKELHRRLAENPPETVISRERWCHIIRTIHAIDSKRFGALFLSGLFGVNRDFIAEILNGHNLTLPEEVESVLMGRFGLAHKWLHTGTGPIN